MNYKPFDLERAIAGDPLTTRDGRPAIFVKFFNNPEICPLHRVFAVTLTKNDPEYDFLLPDIIYTAINGSEYSFDGESDNDLFMAPKTKTYWINIYKYDLERNLLNPRIMYESEIEAKKNADDFLLKTISFEVEE